MTGKILVIDTDDELTQKLSSYLSLEGFETCIATDGETGLKLALNQSFDAIILDILLPHKNGFDLVQTLREYNQTPVIFLTSRQDDIDRLIALDMGADDYLLKPCDPYELLARLRATLRRTRTPSHARPLIQHADIIVDCTQHQVSLRNEPLELTNTEFKILEILIKSPGQAFSKEELTEYALGRKFTAYDRSIDVHISNLRHKLEHNPEGEPWIKTVRGFGYLFNAVSTADAS
jgi:two-component system, OmpR family, response regulator CpxR